MDKDSDNYEMKLNNIDLKDSINIKKKFNNNNSNNNNNNNNNTNNTNKTNKTTQVTNTTAVPANENKKILSQHPLVGALLW